jgi:hypothetical protein
MSCQSSITFARTNVMVRSLYEENTSGEEVKSQAAVRRFTTCNENVTQNAPHMCKGRVHMWTGWRHVCTSFSLLCNLSSCLFFPSRYHITHISLSRAYYLSLLSLSSLPSRPSSGLYRPSFLLRQRKMFSFSDYYGRLFSQHVTMCVYLCLSLSRLGAISSSPDPLPCPFSSHMFPPRVRVNQDISNCEKVYTVAVSTLLSATKRCYSHTVRSA